MPFTRYHLLSLAAGVVFGGLGVWWVKPDSNPPPVQKAVTVIQSENTGAVTTAPALGKAGFQPNGLISDAAGVRLPPANSPAFASLIRSVFNDPSSDRRLGQLRLLLENAEVEHFAALVPLIRENDLRGTGSADEWNVIWKSWGLKDGESAMRFVKTQDWKDWDQGAPQGGQYQAMSGWAASDPEAALAFLETSTDKMYDPAGVRHAMLKGWAVKDPLSAANWLLAKGNGNSNEFQLAMDALCRSGGQAAVDSWFASQKAEMGHDAKRLEQLALAVNHIKTRFEPEKAAQWVEQNLQEPWMAQSPVAAKTADDWAARDPAAAMAWAGKIGVESAVEAAMNRWCGADIEAASRWLRDNPQVPGYGSAVSVMVQHLKDDPAAAAAWADTVTDDATREILLRELGTEPPTAN